MIRLGLLSAGMMAIALGGCKPRNFSEGDSEVMANLRVKAENGCATMKETKLAPNRCVDLTKHTGTPADCKTLRGTPLDTPENRLAILTRNFPRPPAGATDPNRTGTFKLMLMAYSGGAYKLMNVALRDPVLITDPARRASHQMFANGGIMSDEIAALIECTSIAVNSSAQPYAGKVYRGVNMKLTDLATYKDALARSLLISEAAFSSTSRSLELATGWAGSPSEGRRPVVFHIDSVTGRNIEPIALYPEEKEVLFPPGAKFQIIKIVDNGPRTEIHMTEKP